MVLGNPRDERPRGVIGTNGAILIVDADASFRAVVSRLFRRAGFSTRHAAAGEDAVAVARDERPALVLLDVGLPDMSGFEVCQELRDLFGDDLPIIFVSSDRTDPFDRAAGLLVGGDDYLVKPVDRDELLARVRRCVSRTSGRSVVLARGRVDGLLTDRELEVLKLLAGGIGSKEIAMALVISPKTVASHVQHVLAKLGVHTRSEAVAFAYREGILASPASSIHEDVEAHLAAHPAA